MLHHLLISWASVQGTSVKRIIRWQASSQAFMMRASRQAEVYIKRHVSGANQAMDSCPVPEIQSYHSAPASATQPNAAPCVDPTEPIFLGLSAGLWTLWLFFVLSSSYSFGAWNRLGDSCVGCWRNDQWLDLLLTFLTSAVLLLHVALFRAQNLSFGHIHRLGTCAAGLLPSCTSSVPKKTACAHSSYARKNWAVLTLAAVTCLHILVETSAALRLHNNLGLRPCAYKLRSFSQSQQSAIGLDPRRIYLLSHLSKRKQQGVDRQEAIRSYAFRHGYSFVTTRDLFGSYEYDEWLNQTTLHSRTRTFRNMQPSLDHSQVVSLYHVLFEANLQPIPEWVVWIDEGVDITDRTISLESAMLGLCSRVSRSGKRTADHKSTLWCKYESTWSASAHQQAMDSIESENVPRFVIEDTPDVVALGVGSGEVHKFGTDLLFLKNSDWVRDSLFNIFFNSNSGISDETTFNAFFNFQSNPDKVKVLPSCTGLLGKANSMGPDRFHYGDFARKF